MSSFNWPPDNQIAEYTTFSAFPSAVSAGNGAFALALDTDNLYVSNGTSWVQIAGPSIALSLGAFDSETSDARGANLVAGVLAMQSATTTNPGEVNTTTQSFAGNKTFTGTIAASNLSGTNTGDVTLGSFGSTPSSTGASLSGQQLTLQPADATHPGGVSTTTQTIPGAKTFASPMSLAGATSGAATLQAASSTTSYTVTLPNAQSPGSGGVMEVDGSGTGTWVRAGQANGLATLDSSGKIPTGQLPSVVMEYQGAWNPNTNTPTLSDGTGTNGNVYYVTAARSAAVSGLNDPSMVNFQIGDLVIYSSTASAWQLVTPAAGVQSVNGAQGAVTVNAISQLTSDVTAGPASGSQSKAATVAAIQGTSVSGTTGSGNVVFATSPTMTNPVVGTQSTTDNSTKAASTAYVTTAVANAIAGVNPAVAVQAATTAAADTSGLTYNNGVSGIGATLTGSNNTAITIDGYTFTALGQRLLVKNDTQSPSGAFNGIYYVTQVQASLLPPILTRALDYDQPSDINNTGAIPVVNGTVNGTTSWLLTSAVNTIGTDPLTYVKFSVNPSTILTNPMISLQMIYGTSGTGATNATNTGTAGQVPVVNSGATAVAFTTLTAPTKTLKTITGTQAGLLFTISTSTTCAVGDTYTNNANTYTVLIALSSQSGQVLYMSGTGATSGSTLTRATGSGTSSITFSTTQTLASYTAPSGTNFIKVTAVGAGGGSGGCTSTNSSQSTASAGGGGGATVVKWITSPSGTYYYTVGSGGSAGNTSGSAGTAGSLSAFLASNLGPYTAGGGAGGGGGSATTGNTNITGGSAGGTASGGDLNVSGGSTTNAWILGAGQPFAGNGGGSTLAPPAFAISNSTTTGGVAGIGYGGGAIGAASTQSQGGNAGAAGAPGVVIIEEFYQ